MNFKMKKLITILLTFVLSSVSVFAQDVILKNDGSEIRAKVLEITDQQIKYNDFDLKNGPTRTINISDVFMITYQNGKKEVFANQTSTPATTESEDNYALVHIYRPDNIVRGGEVIIDWGCEEVWKSKDFKTKKTIKITKEGSITLHARTADYKEVNLMMNIQFGKEYYVEFTINGWTFRPVLTIKEESVGRKNFNKIK